LSGPIDLAPCGKGAGGVLSGKGSGQPSGAAIAEGCRFQEQVNVVLGKSAGVQGRSSKRSGVAVGRRQLFGNRDQPSSPSRYTGVPRQANKGGHHPRIGHDQDNPALRIAVEAIEKGDSIGRTALGRPQSGLDKPDGSSHGRGVKVSDQISGQKDMLPGGFEGALVDPDRSNHRLGERLQPGAADRRPGVSESTFEVPLVQLQLTGQELSQAAAFPQSGVPGGQPANSDTTFRGGEVVNRYRR
jgi:hypothetical protein